MAARSSPPATPPSVRAAPKTADTDAATMPRGARQARNSRSRPVMDEPRVLTNTAAGRTTTTRTTSRMAAVARFDERASNWTRAASRMKSTARTRGSMVWLKSSMGRSGTCRWLASRIPAAVVA